MVAMIIAVIVFLLGLMNGLMPLHDGNPLTLELAAWSLVALIAFVVMTTKALSPKRASDIFIERF